VLHTTGSLLDKRIRNLITYYRHSNIEHRYYQGLARDEKNILKKIYFYAEAMKLYFYEKTIRYTRGIFAVHENDADYFRKNYSVPVYFIPSFHPFGKLKIKEGKGEYVLFHGNFTVNENIRVAEWILKHLAADLPEIPFVFAGKEPSPEFIEECMKYANVTVESNPANAEMENLISDAHINLVFSFNPEGLKLKMLYSLYLGRFVLISVGLLGTNTVICDAGVYAVNVSEPSIIIKKIKYLFDECFTSDMLLSREKFVEKWSNEKSGRNLLEGMGFTNI
jgi:glycosyltransferase involved in cell wall biosynthesis